MITQAVILAGGMGTRLRTRLGDLPKPMIPIAGKPLLEHQVEMLARQGFKQVLIFACYRADLIAKHFGDGSRWGIDLRIIVEQTPLSTAGAVLAGFTQLKEEFAVLYGDTMVNVDVRRMEQAHVKAGAAATLLLHPNNHPLDSDLVEVNAAGWVTAFYNRPHQPERYFQNLVNAGLYIIKRSALQSRQANLQPMDFGKDLFPAWLREGVKLLGYNTPEFIKDIGTPERYDRVQAEYSAGIIQRSSLETPQRTVFLDRDGTLIVDRDCLRNAEGLELLPGVAEAIHLLNHNGWRTVVVTNQPVIAKGWCDEAELRRIHNKLETLLGKEHAFLDRIYHCPHHPDKGFAGERPELKIDCPCRKPKLGMIQQATTELNIDLTQSWLIGDTTTDIQTAKNADLRSILVQTGAAGKDGRHPVRADLECPDLLTAARYIVGGQ